ncbi:tRNA (guanosine(46)-N7)-methyltransferase TrmB [Oceanipulchritudo coccoides]|nr:tRNA (guanosine(46)-N7)-methyltransferase TrmB [Oceanipulchritudo coccoides]
MAASLPEGQQRFLDRQAERIRRLRETLVEIARVPETVTLEIGCGHGHYLTAYALQHPDKRCIGVDLVTKRILKACQKRDKRNLQNLHFLKAEIREFLKAWPEHLTLERVFILFPDPWPKKRHAKNRILQSSLLDALGQIAKEGTQLHFRTDHPENFAWGMEVIASHADWHIRDDIEWPFENPSFFQDLLGDYQSLTACFSPLETGESESQ